jgi:hypothetical protein
MNMNGFIKAAQAGVVTVVFRKIYDGEIRTMECTLNHELSGGKVPEVLEQQEIGDHLAVYALDRDGWRSFRVDTVIDWYEGKAKQEQVA